MTAHTTKIIEPSKVGLSKNCQSGRVIITTKATAPAGGCNVPVSCVMPIVSDTAMPMTRGEAPKKCRSVRLTSAPKTFPPMTLRGCANGLSGAPKIKTLVAPNGAISKGEFVSIVR